MPRTNSNSRAQVSDSSVLASLVHYSCTSISLAKQRVFKRKINFLITLPIKCCSYTNCQQFNKAAVWGWNEAKEPLTGRDYRQRGAMKEDAVNK